MKINVSKIYGELLKAAGVNVVKEIDENQACLKIEKTEIVMQSIQDFVEMSKLIYLPIEFRGTAAEWDRAAIAFHPDVDIPGIPLPSQPKLYLSFHGFLWRIHPAMPVQGSQYWKLDVHLNLNIMPPEMEPHDMGKDVPKNIDENKEV